MSQQVISSMPGRLREPFESGSDGPTIASAIELHHVPATGRRKPLQVLVRVAACSLSLFLVYAYVF